MSQQKESVEDVKLLGDEQQNLVSSIFLYCLAFFFFLLPIKFGNSFLPTTIPNFPESIIYSGWPGFFLTIIAGALLIAAIVIYRPKTISKTNFLIICSWLLILIATAAFGFYEYDQSYYFYSINQAVIAVLTGLLAAICLSSEERSRRFIIAGICGGLIYTVANGVYQYFWGFQDSINFYREMAAQGVEFPDAQVSRIMQKLVFSHFTISNSFAAHIILTLPLAAYILLNKLNKEHVITCRVFGTSLLIFSFATFMSSENQILTVFTLCLGLILCFGLDHVSDKTLRYIAYLLVVMCIAVLFLTRSRAGITCFIAGLTVAGIICSTGKVRTGCIVFLILGVCLGAYYAPKVNSFQVRLGYYEALLNMVKEQPMGYGFGGFSEYYNRTKGAGIEDSNSPHSFFFGYLGQGGIIAGLTVILCFLLGLMTIVRQKFDRKLKFCLIAGFSSWFIHAQLDFNIMIPGTVAIASIMLMLVQRENTEAAEKSYSPLFTALIPLTITILYFAVQHAVHQSKYTEFHSSLNDLENVPPIDKVKNEMEKLAEVLPYATAHFDEAASWAMKNFDKLEKNDQIQKDNYIIFADEALQKAIEINPNKSSFYTRLARISFERKNYEKTRAMLDKAFELYPYNSAALTLEQFILKEWIRREPGNPVYIEQLLVNRLKRLEIILGLMRFHDHLLLSQNQVERMFKDLDKQVAELYTEIGLIRKVKLKVDTEAISRQLKKIHSEAQKIVGVDR